MEAAECQQRFTADGQIVSGRLHRICQPALTSTLLMSMSIWQNKAASVYCEHALQV